MNFITTVRKWFLNGQPTSVKDWFSVSFDDDRVILRASPPGKQAWEQSFPWKKITRVCFEDGGLASDSIFVFTSLRPESFVVPSEASGGELFWNALVARGHFSADLAAKVMSSTDGAMHCWPPVENKHGS